MQIGRVQHILKYTYIQIDLGDFRMTSFQIGTDALKRLSLWCGKRPLQHQRQIQVRLSGLGHRSGHAAVQIQTVEDCPELLH